MKRGLVAVAVAGAVLFSTTGCLNKATEPFRDAPVSDRNTSPATVGTMPDGFSNFASKCDHGNRVYVAFKADANRAAIAVVPNAEGC